MSKYLCLQISRKVKKVLNTITLLLTCFFVLSPTNLFAQEVNANATRPSAADNGYITEYGYTELELGWFTQENYWSIPALLKFTPLNKLELGFIMSGIVNYYEFQGNSDTEVGDFGVQLKGQLLHVPEIAIAVVGKADFLSESITRGMIYSAFSFPRTTFQVDITAGAHFLIDEKVEDPTFLWAIALGSNFENPLNIYVELFGESREGYSPLGFDIGLTYEVSPDFILDTAYYTGLNDTALDWQIHFGITKTLFQFIESRPRR